MAAKPAKPAKPKVDKDKGKYHYKIVRSDVVADTYYVTKVLSGDYLEVISTYRVIKNIGKPFSGMACTCPSRILPCKHMHMVNQFIVHRDSYMKAHAQAQTQSLSLAQNPKGAPGPFAPSAMMYNPLDNTFTIIPTHPEP